MNGKERDELLDLTGEVGKLRGSLEGLEKQVKQGFDQVGKAIAQQFGEMVRICDAKHGENERRIGQLEKKVEKSQGFISKTKGAIAPTALIIALLAIIIEFAIR